MRPAHAELAQFLRTRRAQLDPAMLGLAPQRRRRTPGLRREEIAELAGIGADWYTRLEQGRNVRPSAVTIDAIAKAMRLTEAEGEHLRQLARLHERTPFVTEQVPVTLARIVESLPLPAYITGQRWDILVWNPAAAALFFDFARLAGGERNILVYMFSEPSARALFGDTWEANARRMVAQFRSNYAEWAGDPAFDQLIAVLSQRSPEFSRWWQAYEVRSQGLGRKQLKHPAFGDLVAEYATLQSNDDRRLKLVMYRTEPLVRP